MSLTFIVKIRLPEFHMFSIIPQRMNIKNVVFSRRLYVHKGHYAVKRQKMFCLRMTILRRVTFGMRLQVDKRIKSIEQ